MPDVRRRQQGYDKNKSLNICRKDAKASGRNAYGQRRTNRERGAVLAFFRVVASSQICPPFQGAKLRLFRGVRKYRSKNFPAGGKVIRKF